jgi:hypothetical protein
MQNLSDFYKISGFLGRLDPYGKTIRRMKNLSNIPKKTIEAEDKILHGNFNSDGTIKRGLSPEMHAHVSKSIDRHTIATDRLKKLESKYEPKIKQMEEKSKSLHRKIKGGALLGGGLATGGAAVGAASNGSNVQDN